ncbi:hypothetical protein [Phragmitibacter flavus]|nr:hypothetical protein [Phragmitibacter flavus]
MPHSCEHSRAALTVDAIVFGFFDTEALKIILIKRALQVTRDGRQGLGA